KAIMNEWEENDEDDEDDDMDDYVIDFLLSQMAKRQIFCVFIRRG
uniref:Uncharacterized protein n=1 Tax=Caenorhabditis japonica TaxID=281687 RepID=A0A8R1IPS8_CAEJA